MRLDGGAGRLTERFIELHSWSTARKTMLLLGVGLVFQAPLSILFVYLTGRSGIVSPGWARMEAISGVAVLLVLTAAAWVEVRLGREGRWTAYASVVAFGSWLGVVIFSAGAWSTPMLAWVLLVMILVGLWYDEQIGWFASAYTISFVVIGGWLTLTGKLGYAPLFVERTLDAQNSAAVAIAMGVAVFGFFAFTFFATLLTVRARRAQEEHLREAHDVIRRYVPAGVADELATGGGRDGFGVERTKLTIFFSDIEGFTDTSDQLDPEDLSIVLNEYLTEMAEIAEAHGASINHFEGDGIMIFFGAPTRGDIKEDALRAVRMAHAMQERLGELHERWLGRGIRAPLEARMGINTGYASVGDFGSPGRKVYTAVGVQVNIAARIQAHCPPGRVLISDSTWGLIRDRVEAVEHGEVSLKGVHYPIPVYQVLAEDSVTSTDL